MTEAPGGTTARLLITCPDRPGIVAAVSGFLFARGANIIDFDQHSTDAEGVAFFMRLEFYLKRPATSPANSRPSSSMRSASRLR